MRKRLTSEERKQLSSLKFNNLYDYSEADFTKVKEKTTVICPIHGKFQISYDKHFNDGIGCKYCSYPSRDLESFIKTAKEIHNDFYSYDNAKYSNAHTPLMITCPIHGDFKQSPNAHLRGQGCPQCARGRSYLEDKIENSLKNEGIEYIHGYKPSWLNEFNRSYLSIDFFIPKINFAIECQGKQHFGLGGWNEKYDFEKQFDRDKRKNRLCKENNVELVYFAKKNEAPKNYIGEIFTDVDELMERVRYLLLKND